MILWIFVSIRQPVPYCIDRKLPQQISSTVQFGYPVVAFSSEDFIGIPVKTPPAVGLLSSS